MLDPIAIQHPNARLWSIDSVDIGKIGSPTPATGGILTVTIEAVQYVPQPKAIKKPQVKPESGPTDFDALIDPLKDSPARTGAAESNFSSLGPDEGTGAIPGSGFYEGSGF